MGFSVMPWITSSTFVSRERPEVWKFVLALLYSHPNGGFRASSSIRSPEQGFLQVFPVVDFILRVERLQYSSGGLRRPLVHSTAGNGKDNTLVLETFDVVLKPNLRMTFEGRDRDA